MFLYKTFEVRVLIKKVLDKGYIKLLKADKEEDILKIAGICYGKKLVDFEKKKEILIKKLMFEHAGNPTSSFEFVNFLFEVKCPIFVARQWMRHRIGSYQEISRRYVSGNLEFFVPEDLDEEEKEKYLKHIKLIENYYYSLINKGIRKEIARSILPLSLYTTFYWQVNLRSLINFLKVRLDKHAQREIREYAKAIFELIKPYTPTVCKFLKESIKE